MLFSSPAWLLLLFALPLFFLRARRLPFSSQVSLAQMPLSVSQRFLALLPRLLMALGFLLLVLALARPVRSLGFQRAPEDARDIMLVLDISGSMDALDFSEGRKPVTRLDALRKVVADFIVARQGDRLGLVVFGDEAYLQCPLTTDTAALLGYLDALKVGQAGRGTAIGDAIGVALKRLKNLPGDTKTLVLVTDGKSNAGALSPLEAAEIAAQLKVKVHVVGIGGAGHAPFLMNTPFGQQIVDQNLEYDGQTLQQIADTTGGRYYNARAPEELAEIYRQIDKLEARRTPDSERLAMEEIFWPFLLAGLMVLLFQAALCELVFVELP